MAAQKKNDDEQVDAAVQVGLVDGDAINRSLKGRLRSIKNG
jgi:hypothetical protein